jgi:hypothetical protein
MAFERSIDDAETFCIARNLAKQFEFRRLVFLPFPSANAGRVEERSDCGISRAYGQARRSAQWPGLNVPQKIASGQHMRVLGDLKV